MKKTDVKKTERSKEFLAEEWLEIVLKGQDKGEGRYAVGRAKHIRNFQALIMR